MAQNHSLNCRCYNCSNNRKFDIPSDLIHDLINVKAILFAGAGISTESPTIFKSSLYSEIKDELDGEIEDDSFPNVMSVFCEQKRNGRKLLLEKVKIRFDYCLKFNELYSDATRFHRELSSLYMIKDIITTNWDTYFEEICHATPIVNSEDYAFNDFPYRKVYKIHGSISNYGSIVATKTDYEKCLLNLKIGLIGSTIKHLLSTNTVIFVGYSFNDFDFNYIIKYLKSELKEIHPHLYIVTLDDNPPKILENFSYTHIKTDGTFFLKKLKEQLIHKSLINEGLDNKRIHYLEMERIESYNNVSDLFWKYRNPSSIYALFYLDGLKHAIQNLIFYMKTGEAYNPGFIYRELKRYDQIIKDFKKNKDYMEVAYLNGYYLGISLMILPKEIEINTLPVYFIFNKEISDYNEFEEIISSGKIFHKTAEKLGMKYFKEFLKSENKIIPVHRPFL